MSQMTEGPKIKMFFINLQEVQLVIDGCVFDNVRCYFGYDDDEKNMLILGDVTEISKLRTLVPTKSIPNNFYGSGTVVHSNKLALDDNIKLNNIKYV